MWSSDNKCFVMYEITDLVINDYFGGSICKIHVDDVSHYFNIIDDNVFDLTSIQFNKEVDYSNYEVISKEKILSNEDIKRRYNLLKSRLQSKLLKEIDEAIFKCSLCEVLVEKFESNTTIYLGTYNDIVLVGETPTRNILDFKFERYSDVVGKIYDVHNYKVLPIYHPSPVSPMSYKGNEPIFNM